MIASHVGRLIQDQNLNVNYNASAGGKTTVSKAPKKGVLGGRKPLSDLSNSVKRTPPKQSFKRHNSNIFSFTDKEIGTSNTKFDGSNKNSVSIAPEKKVKTSNRKALSDITNSGEPHLHKALKKNLNAKLSIVDDEHLSPIAEEPFLHKHERCIEAQTKAMDLDDFMMTIGLHNGLPQEQSTSTWVASPALDKLEPASPPMYLHLKEIPESQSADSLSSRKHDQFFELDSSPVFRSSGSPEHFTQWEDANFMLIKTP